MVQPSKESIPARRNSMNTSEGNYWRSDFFKVLVVVGFTATLAGLAFCLDYDGFLPTHLKGASPSSTSTRTFSKRMESTKVTKKEASPKDGSSPAVANSSGYFTLVSMNIAGCVPSQMAPESWSQQDSIEAVKAEILSHNPDWIALQEAPGGVEAMDQVFGPEGYKAVGATYSNADQVVLLVKKEIEAKLIPLRGFPVIMAELKIGEHRLLAASVHLEPFQQGFSKRAKQMKAIIEIAKSSSLPVVIAGDTNMRPTEDVVMEEDLQLLDVWKLAGSDPRTQFTWDTIDHRHDGTKAGENDEGYFNQYYGETTRQYTARYDRIYVHHAIHLIELEASNNSSPVTFELIANKPMTSKLDFLSDHFGVVSKLPI